MTTTILDDIAKVCGLGEVSDAKFVSRHKAHPGCTYRGDEPETDDLTAWGLAVLRVRDAIANMEDSGGGGNVGGGDRGIVLVLTTEDGDELDYADGSAEFAAVERLLPAGSPNPATVAELSAPTWDGNNHTSADVEPLAQMCRLDAWGHYDASDWLQDADVGPDADADTLVDEAAEVGVHLDADDVQRFIDTLMAGDE